MTPGFNPNRRINRIPANVASRTPVGNFWELEDGSGNWELEDGTGNWELEA